MNQSLCFLNTCEGEEQKEKEIDLLSPSFLPKRLPHPQEGWAKAERQELSL